MKRFWYLVLLAVVAASCTPKEQEDPISLSVTPSELSFGAEDNSTKFVVITTNGSWTAVPADSWIHVSSGSGSGSASISVTADANGQNAARSSSIAVQASKDGKQESVQVTVSQGSSEKTALTASPDLSASGNATTTYQLLVYSFADSDGDGIGDFKGIQDKLDYFVGMGVRALWLSPIHPADSYHGYDVQDYFSVSPLYGTETDFKNLLDAAHAKGIKIYIDYVLNHSGKGNDWFKQALADPSSPYRDYYFFSSNPSADYKNFPMLTGTSYTASEWKTATSGSPKLTVTKTTDAVKTGSSNWNLYMWQDGQTTKELRFVEEGNKLYLITEINGTVGMLIRKYMNWDAGSKFGASGNGSLSEGQTMSLVAEGADISFTGSGRYRVEVTDYTTETLYYMGCFSDWMPDLNYGDPKVCENNACFQDLAASADKWIAMGIDGFRLDAVQHICGGISSYNNSSNHTFLQKWYDHCNQSFKAAGHSDNIFMVGEVWNAHNTEKNYYKGINSCFEFGYWPLLYRTITNHNASSYVSTVSGFVNDHKAVRADAETALFMTNHDHSSQTGNGQARAADDLGKDLAKEKQAAAMILTSPGKPFVYQGEELGYWGNADGKGDEYIRTPILWDKAGKDCAKKGVNNKVDSSMLTGSISVEAQEADGESLLNVYKAWGRLRDAYPALGQGDMSAADVSGSSFAAWYMSSGSQKLLVIHNCAATEKSTTVSDDMSRPIAVLGSGYYRENDLTLGAYSSVVFLL